MCRLFGFRSVIKSQVHQSLVSADNALQVQSNNHPDGWGVGYYLAGAPHIVKSDQSAIEDNIFSHVSGIVSSETVLAHLRNATLGKINILNTHPFQYGKWIFAHNGNIKNYSRHRDMLIGQIDPELRRFILGSTDSEVIFYLILTKLKEKIDLSSEECSISILSSVIKEVVFNLIQEIGDYYIGDDGDDTETYLTFILTNGNTMVAHQGGKELFYSTFKNSCADRDICPSFDLSCENPSENGKINHLIFTSEPLQGDNIWLPMKAGQVIGVDSKMVLDIVD